MHLTLMLSIRNNGHSMQFEELCPSKKVNLTISKIVFRKKLCSFIFFLQKHFSCDLKDDISVEGITSQFFDMCPFNEEDLD